MAKRAKYEYLATVKVGLDEKVPKSWVKDVIETYLPVRVVHIPSHRTRTIPIKMFKVTRVDME